MSNHLHLFQKAVLIIVLLASVLSELRSQETGSNDQVIVENADQAIVETQKIPQVTRYIGNVRAYHKGAFIFCDNAILTGNNLYAVGNVSIIQHDTIQVYSDTLLYQGDSALAYLIKDVVLINTKDTIYAPELRYNLNTKVSDYTQKALMKNGSNELKSQSGYYNTATKDAGFFEKVSITGDSLNLVTDTLYYNTETGQASWPVPSLIENGGSKLFSNSGRYNLNDEIGFFVGNAQYETDTARAIADTMYYSGAIDLIELKGRALYESKTDTARAEKIIYNRAEEKIELEGNARYSGDGNQAKGEKLIYDKKTESFTFTGRSELIDGSLFVEADDLSYQKNTQAGLAIGGVIYRDTSEHITIWADTLQYNGLTNFMKATAASKKPVMATEIDGDTLFISAMILTSYQVIPGLVSKETDTLQANVDSTRISMDSTEITMDSTGIALDSFPSIGLNSTQRPDSSQWVALDSPPSIQTQNDSSYHEIIDTTLSMGGDFLYLISDSLFVDTVRLDTIQYLEASKDVVLYKSDMQARCDSLIFTDRDSIFTLMKEPVMWSDTSQITGDTIKIKLLDKKIDELIVNENAFMTNSPDFIYFNQIKGKTFVADFDSSVMKTMKVNGNAQIIYYMLDDDKAYIGVNTTDCSYMTFYFQDKKITDIRFYNSPQSKILPMTGTDHESIKLKGFSLRFKERPLSKDELFLPLIFTEPVIESEVLEVTPEEPIIKE